MPIDAKGALGYLLEYGAALFWETLLAWRIFLTRGFHVVQGCNPPDLIFLIALQFRLFGVRFVFDHHDINPELYEAKFNKRGPFWRMIVWLERLTFKTASVSIATNNSYRQIAIERGGMDPDRVFVVRSGPDLGKLRRVPPVGSWRNGARHLVGYVGVMGDQEGIDLLIDAIGHIVRDLHRTDVHFCLVGGGPSLAGLQQMVAERGLTDYVTFTGRAPDQTLFEVLSTMDVGVNPDQVNPMNDKSTMNKILEYMAFEKPIVQFDVIEGRYSAGDASLYARANDSVDFARCIVKLLDDPAKRAEMGAIGRQRVEERFSWRQQVDTLISTYKKVFAR